MGWTVDMESSCEGTCGPLSSLLLGTQNSSPGRDPICYSTSVTAVMIKAAAGSGKWIVPEEKKMVIWREREGEFNRESKGKGERTECPHFDVPFPEGNWSSAFLTLQSADKQSQLYPLHAGQLNGSSV